MRFSRLLRLGAQAAHGHGHGGSSYHGFTAPHVEPINERIGRALGAAMWFWVFYRISEDGDVLLGMRKPWDHRGHHDHEEGHEETHAATEKHH